MYIQTFGYGSICASFNGYPQKEKYDASQFEYKAGKFYIKQGGRLDLRSILPQGRTYGDLLSDFKRQNSAKYTDVISEGQYWIVYMDHITGGIQTHWGTWPTDPNDMIKEEGMVFPQTLDGGALEWNTSGLMWDQADNMLKVNVGTWLDYAQSGWQMYIVNTVGWDRWRPEAKYWDWDKGQYVTPAGSEFAPPIGYCIVEVK